MQGADPEPELEAIRQLPVEERYVWRVASALRWAFADLDDLSVRAEHGRDVADDGRSDQGGEAGMTEPHPWITSA
jgi:hypothetical protein